MLIIAIIILFLNNLCCSFSRYLNVRYSCFYPMYAVKGLSFELHLYALHKFSFEN